MFATSLNRSTARGRQSPTLIRGEDFDFADSTAEAGPAGSSDSPASFPYAHHPSSPTPSSPHPADPDAFVAATRSSTTTPEWGRARNLAAGPRSEKGREPGGNSIGPGCKGAGRKPVHVSTTGSVILRGNRQRISNSTILSPARPPARASGAHNANNGGGERASGAHNANNANNANNGGGAPTVGRLGQVCLDCFCSLLF
jgi:hypothetical protein